MAEAPWVLLVEDNPDHVLLIREALTAGAEAVAVCHVGDGEAALELLRHRDGSLPAAILLDLKLPKVDGLDVLRAVRAADRYAGVPVFVLTTSDIPGDAAACRRNGATAYLIKPAGFSLLSRRGLAVAGLWPDAPPNGVEALAGGRVLLPSSGQRP